MRVGAPLVVAMLLCGCVNARHAEVKLANNPDGADCFARCVQSTQGDQSVDCVAACPGGHKDSGDCSGGACVEARKMSTGKTVLLLLAVGAVAFFAVGGP